MIKIMTDTTASLSREEYQRNGITPIPLLVNSDRLSGKELFEVAVDEFYALQREGVKFATSHLEPEAFMEYFQPAVEAGQDVICILLSGKISPCVSAALRAKEMLKTDRIAVVDSRQSGYGQAIMALRAKKLADLGRGKEEILAELDDLRARTHTFFIVESLDHLKAGGRFFWDQALVASLLRIKPIIWFDENGKMMLNNKISSVKEVQARILRLIQDYGKRGLEELVLHYADNRAEAEGFAGELERVTGVAPRLVKLSAVVGAHTGPDLIGPCIVTKT